MEKKLISDVKNSPIKFVIGGILVLAVLFVGYQVYLNKIVASVDAVDSYQGKKIPEAWTSELERRNFYEFFTISRPLRPARKGIVDVSIRGKITEIHVKNGDLVDKGQVLATIDDTETKGGLDAVRSQITAIEEKIRNTAEIAQILKQRVDLTKEAALRDKLDNARQEYARARRDYVKTAKKRKALAKKRRVLLDKLQNMQSLVKQATIRAPASGTIAGLTNQEGDFPSHPICEILATSEFIVEIPVERAISLTVGQKVFLETNEGSVHGKIAKTNRNRQEIIVIVEVEDPPAVREQNITWKFAVREHENTPAIRKRAVVSRDGEKFLYAIRKVDHHQKVFAIPVAVDFEEGQYYLLSSSVLEDIDWNTRIIVQGHDEIKAGDTIEITRE